LIVSFNAAEAGVTPPRASVAVAIKVCTPGANALPGVTDQVPPAATTAVPTAVAPSNNVTVSPAVVGQFDCNGS
jgi:hypothetical protein